MSVLIYNPNGTTGYTCRLTSADGKSLRLHRSDGEDESTVDGDDKLISNRTLVGGLESFARNELEYRRSRQKNQKKLLRKSAQQSEDLIKSLVDLTDHVGTETTRGFCSECLDSTAHRKVTRWMVPAAYLCASCGTSTTECFVPGCDHMARRSSRQIGLARYCAQHRHEIPSFQRLDTTLVAIDKYEPWLEFDSRNVKRLATIAAGALGGALLIGPAFFVAAPAIGGSIGAWTGLSGAAATSHGLALLGGGAVSAGGLGMAGGTAVVTAVGASLGTGLGASVTSAYVGDDDSFGIDLVEAGDGAPVIFSSGFLTEDEDGWGRWEEIIRSRYPGRPVYRVRWGAKELKDLRALVGRGAGSGSALSAVARFAARASRTAATKFGVLGGLITSYELAKNPWSVARTRAEMTGAVLADLIARTETERFVLVGHSLGARVMMEATRTLTTKDGPPRLEDVHLLGAAIDSGLDLRSLETAVAGHVYNYWSKNDAVLSRGYRSIQRGEHAAGAEGFAQKSTVVRNRNVSRMVRDHSGYVAEVTLESLDTDTEA
ncbi:MAG: pimeloyl-ACP methyl ester carboxylesterase [Verrucomicrobiales bacterium]|jgi:pimeloyl-ACP methyl ester carboxylesterase